MKYKGMILNRRPPAQQAGFTLVELLVSIVVAAILITVGIPSFASLFESTRLSTESNNLIIAMNLARSEAVKRGSDVLVVQQDTSKGWNGGFKSGYDDDTNDFDLDDANAEIFQEWMQIPGSIEVSNDITAVRFLADGSLVVSSGNISHVISLQPKGCEVGESRRRELKFSNTGKVRVVREDCVA